jgi:hypothetical protein
MTLELVHNDTRSEEERKVAMLAEGHAACDVWLRLLPRDSMCRLAFFNVREGLREALDLADPDFVVTTTWRSAAPAGDELAVIDEAAAACTEWAKGAPGTWSTFWTRLAGALSKWASGRRNLGGL